MTTTNQTFRSLAFPVAKVRYSGANDTRGSRWIASLRRDNERTYRVREPYDHAERDGVANALPAAIKCLERSLAENNPDASASDYVAIPGDFSADTYVFTFVPTYFFA